MLPPRVPRRIVRSPLAWARPPNDVCVFCRSACAPNVFQRAYARYPAPKAPSTKTELERKRARIMSEQDRRRWADPAAHAGKVLPEVSLIEFLKKAGLIQAEPATVMRLVDEMRELGTRLDGIKARELCHDHGVALDDMPLVARACLSPSCASPIQKLGKIILLAMAANEVPQATLHLLRAADRQDESVSSPLRKAFDSSELVFARHHLRKLVAQKHPEAMVFHAQRLAKAGKRREAIDLLRDAISSGAANEEDHEDGDTMHKKYAAHVLKDTQVAKGESPWTMLARLEVEEGNFGGAQAAFRSGAFAHDDPRAYQGLAGTVKEYSRRWLEYMTKAASSGAWGATHKLAQFYTVPLDKIPDEDLRSEMEHLEQHGKPIEWWYFYYNGPQLKRLGEPPETRVVQAEFWRHRDEVHFAGVNSPDVRMVMLNPREALAMEWYELAFQWSNTATNSWDRSINLNMQEILDRAALTNKSKPSKKSMDRRLSVHHAAHQTLSLERLVVSWEEAKATSRRESERK
ncbi:putative tetratricopeptide-like helical protein [Neofusicoccum parvum]|nr:putative tetratricopeptide-like helical protein [Neofusicoccum parvum]